MTNYNIEFGSATLEANPLNKEGNPMLTLNASVNNTKVKMSGGAVKWNTILKALPEMNNSYKNKVDGVLFKYPLTIGQKGIIVSEPMLDLLNHFETDIKEYVKKYYVLPARECVVDICKKEEMMGLDIITYMLIPTYPKRDQDVGEGLGAWKLTAKAAKFWCSTPFGDVDPLEYVKEWMEKHEETHDAIVLDLTTQDGKSYQRKMDYEQQIAFVNYFNNILRWSLTAK